MRGYWNDDAATKKVLTEGMLCIDLLQWMVMVFLSCLFLAHWMHTGDLGVMDSEVREERERTERERGEGRDRE